MFSIFGIPILEIGIKELLRHLREGRSRGMPRPDQMSNLVVAVFNDESRAQQAMGELMRLYKPRTDLNNALLLTWHGKDPIAQQSQNLADGVGAGWGLLWGALISSVTLGSDEIETAAEYFGVGTRDSDGRKVPVRQGMDIWESGIQVPTEFFRDIQALVTPGRSAIFFVSRSTTLVTAAGVTRGYGGTLLVAPLSALQLSKIRKFVRCPISGAGKKDSNQ